MKKIFSLLLFLLLLSCIPALAEEAQDVTHQCKITASSQYKRVARLSDRDYLTGFISDKQKNASVEIAAPKGQPIYGVYVCFGGKLTPWVVEAKKGGKWVGVYQSEGAFAHEYAPLPDGETDIRVRVNSDKQAVLAISELFVFGEGDTPSYVQQWQPTPEKCDLLVLAGHPDDEILWFAGLMPVYGGERKLKLQVTVMVPTGGQRKLELLSAIWHCGVKYYPEDQPLLTDLFPVSMNKGKHNVIFYVDEKYLRQYLRLKMDKRVLLAIGTYSGEDRTNLARAYGRLLSYSDEGIERLLNKNSEKE